MARGSDLKALLRKVKRFVCVRLCETRLSQQIIILFDRCIPHCVSASPANWHVYEIHLCWLSARDKIGGDEKRKITAYRILALDWIDWYFKAGTIDKGVYVVGRNVMVMTYVLTTCSLRPWGWIEPSLCTLLSWSPRYWNIGSGRTLLNDSTFLMFVIWMGYNS